MSSRNPILLSVTAILVIVATRGPAQSPATGPAATQPARPKLSGRYNLLVHWDTRAADWTSQTMEALLTPDAALEGPARDALGVPVEALKPCVQRQHKRSAHGWAVLEVHVDLRPIADRVKAGGSARGFVAALAAMLEQTLSAAQHRQARRYTDALQARKTTAQSKLQELQTQRRALCAKYGSASPDPARVLAEVRDLTSQLQRITLDLAVEEARMKALSEQIAQITKQAERSLADDPVAKELEKVVALLAKRPKHAKLLMKEGRTSQRDVDDALITLAEAKIRLAERREKLARDAVDGKMLAEYRLTLVNGQVNAAEGQARKKLLTDRLAKLAKPDELLEAVDKYKRLEEEIALARDAHRHVSSRLRQHERNLLDRKPPTVTVAGVPQPK
jgi:hypothetical protein